MLVKKIIISSMIASLGCSSAVLAAGMFPTEWKKSDEGIWQAYVEGQFVHQSNNLARSTQIGVPATKPLISSMAPSDSPTLPLLDGNPDQDWGFGFGLGYVFASKKYDVRAHYFSLNSDRTQSASSDFTSEQANKAILFLGSDTQETNNYDYSEADITFGHFINLSKRLTMRLGYGLQFADIKQHSRSHSIIFPNPDELLQPATLDQNFDNKFKGVGPAFTVDGQYDLTHHFALVGALGASALYGKSTATYYSTGIIDVPDEGIVENNFDYEAEDHKIALGLDTRLGLKFSKVVSENAAVNVEAGYEAIAYINALQEGNFNMILDDSGFAPGASIGNIEYRYEDDYNNYGPYVRIGVDFK